MRLLLQRSWQLESTLQVAIRIDTMADVGDGGRHTFGVPSSVSVHENRPGKSARQTNRQQRSRVRETVDAGCARNVGHRILSDRVAAETMHAGPSESVQIRFGLQSDQLSQSFRTQELRRNPRRFDRV